ncbi:unnamed protein product [Arabis nemorensis]|uniref:Uncharacterized protein n=1 Tax=Arabis nemorensis TaxID=586526 RepID=A0A565BEL7_9BRAS|nr:unnamed protein product [Arabis nemorensis]
MERFEPSRLKAEIVVSIGLDLGTYGSSKLTRAQKRRQKVDPELTWREEPEFTSLNPNAGDDDQDLNMGIQYEDVPEETFGNSLPGFELLCF